jgi:hypothetical protein
MSTIQSEKIQAEIIHLATKFTSVNLAKFTNRNMVQTHSFIMDISQNILDKNDRKKFIESAKKLK